jgi:hypothetical protein
MDEGGTSGFITTRAIPDSAMVAENDAMGEPGSVLASVQELSERSMPIKGRTTHCYRFHCRQIQKPLGQKSNQVLWEL